MLKNTSLITSALVLQAIVFTGLNVAKADVATAPAPTHAQELEAKFDAASTPLSVQDLMGAYLGRCFDPSSDNPQGMILSTVQKQIGADEGPLFPSTSIYNLAMIEATSADDLTPEPSSDNDSVTQASLDHYWANPTLVSDGTSYDMQEADLQLNQNTALETGTVTTTIGSKPVTVHVYIRVKKGDDGYFYARQGSDSNSTGTVVSSNVNMDRYCYFWQKLTPQ